MAISLDIAYSATSSGLECFSILKGIHCVELSLYLTSKSHPAVVFRMRLLPRFVLIYISSGSTASLFFLWSIISFNNWYLHPSGSTWEYIFSAITFAPYSLTLPSENSTSYDNVFKRGLLSYCPTIFPFPSFVLPTTLALRYSSPWGRFSSALIN